MEYIKKPLFEIMVMPIDYYITDSKDFYMDFHTHVRGTFEINYVTKGSCDYYVGKDIYHMKAKNVIVLDGSTSHRLVFDKGENAQVVGIFCEAMDKSLGCISIKDYFSVFPEIDNVWKRAMGGAVVVVDNEKNLFPQMEGIIEERRSKCNYAYLNNLLSRCLVDIAREIDQGKEGSIGRVAEAKLYMSSHYALIKTIDDIADAVHINKVYLQRKFSEETGETIWNYFNDLRLSRAAALLAETDFKVEQVIETVGFNSRQSFIGLFRKKYKVSPSDYRKLIKKSKK